MFVTKAISYMHHPVGAPNWSKHKEGEMGVCNLYPPSTSSLSEKGERVKGRHNSKSHEGKLCTLIYGTIRNCAIYMYISNYSVQVCLKILLLKRCEEQKKKGC
jgi:hypothetical protein